MTETTETIPEPHGGVLPTRRPSQAQFFPKGFHIANGGTRETLEQLLVRHVLWDYGSEMLSRQGAPRRRRGIEQVKLSIAVVFRVPCDVVMSLDTLRECHYANDVTESVATLFPSTHATLGCYRNIMMGRVRRKTALPVVVSVDPMVDPAIQPGIQLGSSGEEQRFQRRGFSRVNCPPKTHENVLQSRVCDGFFGENGDRVTGKTLSACR